MRTKGLSKKTPARRKFVKKKAEELSRYGLLPAFMKALPKILQKLDKNYPGLCLIGNCNQLKNEVKNLKTYDTRSRYGKTVNENFDELVYLNGQLAVLRDFDYVEILTASKEEFANLPKNFLIVEGCSCFLKLGKKENSYGKDEFFHIDIEII